MALAMFRNMLSGEHGVLGINGRNLDLIYPLNDRKHFPNVDDKLLCKKLLSEAGIPVPKTYHVIDSPSALDGWTKSVGNTDSFVVKPNCGYGGNGIILVRRDGDGWVVGGEPCTEEDISFHVLEIFNGAFSRDNVSDTAYMEQMVVNHRDLAQFIGEGVSGVADMRLIFRETELVMAMMRLPTRKSGGRANLHQGGLGIGIDISNGKSLQGCQGNDVISHHPETGEPLPDKSIPFWREMAESGSRISDVVGLGYIGVDFVCDDTEGPLVLEVNARPGLNIQIANQAGLRARLI